MVKDAKLTRDVEFFITMDPYVKLVCGSTTFKTKVANSGGKTPAWNDEFELVDKAETDTNYFSEICYFFFSFLLQLNSVC